MSRTDASTSSTFPAPITPEAADVVLLTSDGLRLEGAWQPREGAIATAVLVHGFSASRRDEAVCSLGRDLLGVGLNVLAYDARGHGRSEGLCGVGSTEHLDVASAVEHAALAGLPVVLIGVSMGAVAVVNFLASEPPTASSVIGAVLVSAPARWRMRVSPLGILTAALTRTRPGRFIASRRLGVRVASGWCVGESPASAIRRIALPLAIVHGAGDRLLAVVHGRQLHASAAGPARLEVVEGMGHGIDEGCRRAAIESVGWILDLHAAIPSAKD